VVAREQQSEWELLSTAAKRPREQLPQREPPHTTVKGPGKGSPRGESEAKQRATKMQSFLALGQEILLSRGGAPDKLQV
jgi:hypothetical protein